ncbi:hypothetical protein GU926_03385 [Nibribacter ruber]|uniref:STAS/SEC14 domain-containing protein n=1 Tax=Nibribacter ruber TaxID=2698458 RepID=A0A6P1NW24_9BACT|nr:hypothetical protein [Nibribacter ruber]QHL86534.1 hypothetical protein GU926_03385 [Nibribacter ruber]
MQINELKKVSGEVYFEVRRSPDNAYLFVNWVGRQSLESIMLGGNQILALLREQPCKAVINSNQELVGPWEVGVPYLALKWVPSAIALGLRYFAHITAPGVYGQRSYDLFKKSVQVPLLMHQFKEVSTAELWLEAQTLARNTLQK